MSLSLLPFFNLSAIHEGKTPKLTAGKGLLFSFFAAQTDNLKLMKFPYFHYQQMPLKISCMPAAVVSWGCGNTCFCDLMQKYLQP